MNRTYEDAFNLLCGEVIGEGSSRVVYECKIRPDLVVKVERDDGLRDFSNVREEYFWSWNEEYKKVSNWLAPCEYLSPDGRILLQRRADPLPADYKLPKTIPEFLADLKPENFGLLDGKLVCVDYAMTITNPPLKKKKAYWNK